MLDLLIVSVPGTTVNNLFAAPAILKAAVSSAGFTCRTIDYNIIFYNTVDQKNIKELEQYFTTGVNVKYKPMAEELVSVWADEILKYNPRYLGISVFTYQNRIATELLCAVIRKKSSIKIVLGGQGLSDGGILGHQGFAKRLISDGLANHYIKSEGERALVELLRGNFNYAGIDSDDFKQIDDLNSLPIPDYSDYDLSLYEKKMFPVTFSRGCVRACSFCDIHDHWKYRYREGAKVAQEMITLYNKYDVTEFYFTDSLVNGSLREFNKFCKIMAEYNENNINKIKWAGQYIVRAENSLSEEYWSNLSKSGASRLAIGVETGSDTVRLHMNKKFTNADMDYTMKMLEKYNITCVLLMIIGYPTETEFDFQETLNMFKKYQHLANSIIVDINLGSTLGILPGTPLYNQSHEHNIVLDKYENNWIANDNPTLTLQERLKRIVRAREYVTYLGYSANNDSDNMISSLELQIPIFEKRNKIKKMIQIKEEKTNSYTKGTI